MPKAQKRDRKAAAQKAWATIRKRQAAGKAAPPTAAQKAAATLRKRKLAREGERKASEALMQKNLGQTRGDTQDRAAEIAAAGRIQHDARCALADGGTNNLGQPVVDARSTSAEMAPPATAYLMPAPGVSAAPASAQTAMRAAFEKAGINTARVELEQQVKALLGRNNNDPTRMLGAFDTLILRRRDLRQVLLVEYAARLAGAEAALTEAAEANVIEAKEALAQHGNGKSAYRRAPVIHTRSEAQKASARRVMAESLGIWSRKIGDRPLGVLNWGELGTLKQESIKEAGKHTLAGMYRAADAILIDKIQGYAQVRDAATLVRDVVPDDVLTRFNKEAAQQAPRVVDLGRTAYEGTLTKQIEQRT